MAVGTARRGGLGAVVNRGLLTLMFAHMTLDMNVGLMPVLFPYLIDQYGLDLKTVGLVTFAYSGLSSIVQPLFGWIADRWGTRYAGLAVAMSVAAFASLGFAPNFPTVVALAGLAGMGSGAFHPMGAVNVRSVSLPAVRNAAMSVFITGGWVGVAIAPVVGAAALATFGERATLMVLPTGLLVAAWLLVELRTLRRPPEDMAPPAGTRRTRSATAAGLLAAVAVSMAQSWTVVGAYNFTPTWYRSLGYDAGFYGALATTLLIGTACGTASAGWLADRYGRRRVIVGCLVLLAPATLLFAQFTGPPGFVSGALVGFLSAAPTPLILVLTQGLTAGRAGAASGLILGLGFVSTAFGVPLFGAIADAFGLQNAMRLQAVFAVATAALACRLPNEREKVPGVETAA